jgi:hypothetical protein
MAACPAVTGCGFWVDGFWTDLFGSEETDDTGSDGWLGMVPNGQNHTLEFADPPGSVTYRVEIVVDDRDLLFWFGSDEDQAVAAVDAVLLPWGVERFATDDGFDDVEAEIGPALVAAWGGGVPAEDIVLETTLIVANCDVEDEDSGTRGAR